MFLLKAQCTWHYAKLKSNHRDRFPSCTLYPKPPVVSNWTCVLVKHEARVPSDISHELGPARLPCPCVIVGPSAWATWGFQNSTCTFWASTLVSLQYETWYEKSTKSIIFSGFYICLKAARMSTVFRGHAYALLSHIQFIYTCPSAQSNLIHVHANWHRQEALAALWVLAVSKGTGVLTPNGN